MPAEVVLPLDPADDLLGVPAGQCVVSIAWHMVNRLALTRLGDLALVPSASGGWQAHWVQCTKLVGPTVSTPAKADNVTSLGADMVIMRGDGDIATDLTRTTVGHRFDPVLDTEGGQLFGAYLSVLRCKGTLVTCGAHAVPLFWHGWRIVGFMLARADDLAASLALIQRADQGAHRRYLPGQPGRRPPFPGTALARWESAPRRRANT